MSGGRRDQASSGGAGGSRRGRGHIGLLVGVGSGGGVAVSRGQQNSCTGLLNLALARIGPGTSDDHHHLEEVVVEGVVVVGVVLDVRVVGQRLKLLVAHHRARHAGRHGGFVARCIRPLRILARLILSLNSPS